MRVKTAKRTTSKLLKRCLFEHRMAASTVFLNSSASTAATVTAGVTLLGPMHGLYAFFGFLKHSHLGMLSLRATTSLMHSGSESLVTSVVSTVTAATETYAKAIDGNTTAKQIRDEIAAEVSRMKEAIGVTPGLAVILIGGRKDSAIYVHNKKEACEAVGIRSFGVELSADSTEKEVIEFIVGFNEDPAVHGILVQLPLPSHMCEEKILNAVRIEKDVDGFNPLNIGRLAMLGREPSFVPCTPKGCIELLHRYGVIIKGKKAVVIGRSNVVGMPAALLLQREDATVTVVNSETQNPEEISRQADIVISAVGQPNLVRGSWIKPGAVVLDVGVNPVEDPEDPSGYRLVGDVCYEEVCKVASAVTPVPGGVGPMTVAMLLSNTLISAKRIHNFT